ncbi:Uncharacterised protein [Mycobacteroides abscessus subsp. abscessus]|nr:Uncharacterised protein [Mycobacteroides abscessus subsp. abscessus]
MTGGNGQADAQKCCASKNGEAHGGFLPGEVSERPRLYRLVQLMSTKRASMLKCADFEPISAHLSMLALFVDINCTNRYSRGRSLTSPGRNPPCASPFLLAQHFWASA